MSHRRASCSIWHQHPLKNSTRMSLPQVFFLNFALNFAQRHGKLRSRSRWPMPQDSFSNSDDGVSCTNAPYFWQSTLQRCNRNLFNSHTWSTSMVYSQHIWIYLIPNLLFFLIFCALISQKLRILECSSGRFFKIAELWRSFTQLVSDFNAAEVMKVQDSEAVIAAGLSVEAWLDSGDGAAGPKDQKCFWRQREGFAGRQGGNFWVLVLQIISSHNEIVAAFFCKALKRRFQMALLALYQLGHASQRFWDVFFHLLLSRFSWCFFSIFEVVCSSFWRCSKARAPRYMETNDMFGSLEIHGLLMFVEGGQWLALEKTHLWTGVPGLIFFI